MLRFLLVIALALAEETPPVLAEVWAALAPVDVLDEGVRRLRHGDWEGAEARFHFLQLDSIPSEVKVQAGYHLAMAHEFQEEFEEALEGYEALITNWPDSSYAADAAFRRALCLEDLGRHEDSLVQVRVLQQQGHWDQEDAWSLALQQGVVELRGRRQRRGLRRLHKVLGELADSGSVSWLQAKARTSIARHQLSMAADIPLVGNRRAARNLKRRTSLMAAAEKQVLTVVTLEEPEFILEGLKNLGDAYLVLHDDLLAAPPPRSLDEAQVEAYRSALRGKVRVLRTKAWRYYGQGIAMASRTRWTGRIVGELEERHSALAPSPEDVAP